MYLLRTLFNVRFLVLAACISGAAACSKKTTALNGAPVANFVIVGDTVNGLVTVGTYDRAGITDKSLNAASYAWDFGNDSVSSERTPILSYAQAGLYTVALTVTNSTGQTSLKQIQIRVMDRFIRKVVITKFQDQRNGTGSIQTTNPVYAVVKLGENNKEYPAPASLNEDVDAPVLFRSDTIETPNIDSVPYTFTLPQKIPLNFPALGWFFKIDPSAYKGIGYGLELHEIDGSNDIMLSSSFDVFYSAQAGDITWSADIIHNTFIAEYGDIQLICDYE